MKLNEFIKLLQGRLASSEVPDDVELIITWEGIFRDVDESSVYFDEDGDLILDADENRYKHLYAVDIGEGEPEPKPSRVTCDCHRCVEWRKKRDIQEPIQKRTATQVEIARVQDRDGGGQVVMIQTSPTDMGIKSRLVQDGCAHEIQSMALQGLVLFVTPMGDPPKKLTAGLADVETANEL